MTEFLKDLVKMMCALMFAFGVATASNVIETIIVLRRNRGKGEQ